MCFSVGPPLRVDIWTYESNLGKFNMQQRKCMENKRPANQHIPLISTASPLHTIRDLRNSAVNNNCSSRTNVTLKCFRVKIVAVEEHQVLNIMIVGL
jgi:hypothetical protein